ncbi:MAG: succinylglutamate desuccinylase/aspartoacylase family protein [Alphaproteobacteria bacterium]|nr:succinylglutamate desuccinylase/aspartoacylase family protein [Alphaproteobacteria bacterium]
MSRLAPGHHTLWPTVHATVLDAREPGPTALVQAGIHGDEIAGVHALQELLEEGLRPRRGRLVVIPVMNPPAYRARTRAVEGGLDLNRSFPGDPAGERYETRLAATYLALCESERPALVATLHESRKRYDPAVVPSFGQTLVYGVDPCPPLLQQVVDGMNEVIPDPEERWATLYYPVATSSTEIIVDRIGCIGVCVETWSGFPERRRIDMHRDVVLRLLEGVGVGVA